MNILHIMIVTVLRENRMMCIVEVKMLFIRIGA